MNKAFIFDWSGTLSDNFHLFCKVCDLVFTELGRETITPEEISRNITLPYMKFWNRYFPDLAKDKLNIIYEKYIHEVGDPEPFEYIVETLTYLKNNGYQLFVISSDPVSKLIPEIKKFGLSEMFTKTIGEVHEKDEHIVSLLNDYSLDQDSTYYIGDTSGDVEAGKSAGVKTIGITWGFQHLDVLSQSRPDYLINHITEIKRIA